MRALWGVIGIVLVIAAVLLGPLMLLRDTSRLGLPKRKPGDPPLKPRWDDEPDDWPKKPDAR